MSETNHDTSSGQISDWVPIIRGRGAFYEFFSLAYRQPADENFLDIMKQYEPHFAAAGTEINTKNLKTGAGRFSDFVSRMDSIDNLLSDLNRSYTSLFLLGASSVPTSESVYLSPDRLVKQEPWEEVMKMYARHKFGIPASFKEPEDHVSIELLFMHFLAEKAAKALEENDEDKALDLIDAQKDFLNNHIMRWVPTFCDAVISKAGAHVIMLDAVTILLKGFLEYDKEFLDTLTTSE